MLLTHSSGFYEEEFSPNTWPLATLLILPHRDGVGYLSGESGKALKDGKCGVEGGGWGGRA